MVDHQACIQPLAYPVMSEWIDQHGFRLAARSFLEGANTNPGHKRMVNPRMRNEQHNDVESIGIVSTRAASLGNCFRKSICQ